MHALFATSYGNLSQFLFWGMGWIASIVVSVLAFVLSWLSVRRKSLVYSLASLSFAGGVILALMAWLPSLGWHPNDRDVMVRAVAYTGWLPVVSFLVMFVRTHEKG